MRRSRTILIAVVAILAIVALGLMVALCYLLVGLPFARLARVVEARFARHLKREAA